MISDDGIVFGLMPLNPQLEDHVRWWLAENATEVNAAELDRLEQDVLQDFSDGFLFYPSNGLRSTLAAI